MTTPDTPCAVDGPIGPDRQVGSAPNGRLAGIAAPRIGRDTIKTGATTLARYGVSLLEGAENGPWRVEQILFRENVIAASSTKNKIDHSFWTKIALLALAVPLVEWRLFQKRRGGLPRAG